MRQINPGVGLNHRHDLSPPPADNPHGLWWCADMGCAAMFRPSAQPAKRRRSHRLRTFLLLAAMAVTVAYLTTR